MQLLIFKHRKQNAALAAASEAAASGKSANTRTVNAQDKPMSFVEYKPFAVSTEKKTL